MNSYLGYIWNWWKKTCVLGWTILTMSILITAFLMAVSVIKITVDPTVTIHNNNSEEGV
jgi:hypothetical protein